MKVRELLGIGFNINFVPGEEGVEAPSFFLEKGCSGVYVRTETINMREDQNMEVYCMGYLDNKVNVVIFDNPEPLDRESVLAVSKTIDVIKEATPCE